MTSVYFLLGKTVQTIACMLLNQPTENVCNSPSSTFKKRLNSRPKFRTLIVVPVSLMDQWHDELLKFVHPSLRIRVLRYHSAFLKQSERKSLEDDPEHLYRYDGECPLISSLIFLKWFSQLIRGWLNNFPLTRRIEGSIR